MDAMNPSATFPPPPPLSTTIPGMSGMSGNGQIGYPTTNIPLYQSSTPNQAGIMMPGQLQQQPISDSGFSVDLQSVTTGNGTDVSSAVGFSVQSTDPTMGPIGPMGNLSSPNPNM